MRDGRKEVLAIEPGFRESTESWSEVFRNLAKRGIDDPKLIVGDGNSGIWGAVANVWPGAGEQRCWNHKIRNVVDKVAKSHQAEATQMLKAIPYAPTKAEAERLRDEFVKYLC